jgi:hypothetical protein
VSEQAPHLEPKPRSVRRAFVVVGIVVLLVGAGLCRHAYFPKTYSPTQPLPFSHSQHVGQLKLDCTVCHNRANQGPQAGIPDASTCLMCHQHILPDSPLLEQIRQAGLPSHPSYTGRPVRWIQVNRLPGHVYFSHQAHVTRGVGCAECHGNMASVDRVSAPDNRGMKWCLSCHRDPSQKLRPLEAITAPDYDPATWLKAHPQFSMRPDQLSPQLQQQWKIRPTTDCTGCHH